MGSLRVWQEAQTLLSACAIKRSRRVLSGLLSSLTAVKSTSFGGSGVGAQRKMSSNATPRLVGDERPGCENIDSMLICVRRPLRPESAGNSYFTQSPAKVNGT